MEAIRVFLAGLALAVVAVPASAQELGGSDREKVTFNEIERGFYADGQVGALFLSTPGTGGGLGTGTDVSVSIGYDFTSFLGAGIFCYTAQISAPSGYSGLSAGGAQQGDFTGFMPGVEIRLHLPIARDQNDVERLFVNLGVGGGLMFLQPTSLFPSSGEAPGGKANVGLEYFTRLRHFSVGLAFDLLATFPSGGTLFGGSLSPFVRYSF